MFSMHAETYEALLKIMLNIFSDCHRQGLPPQMVVSKLVPVPKGAPSADPNKHRGIAVSSVFSRLFEGVLYRRGNKVAEELQLRVLAQCGFREGSGPLDALFVMQHLVEKATFDKKRLCVVMVDFAKAFDSASRAEMLARCERLGMVGPYAEMLVRVYERVQLTVCSAGEQGKPIDTCRGTKQGSQLSPLVFGLFLEQFAELVSLTQPLLGPEVDGVHVPLVMYADDVNLIIEGGGDVADFVGLQKLLHVLELFCEIFDMEVNISKTWAIIFQNAHMSTVKPQLYYKGTRITQVVLT
jgi:hypothetical protein